MDMGPKYCDLHKLDMYSALIHRRVKRGRKSGQQDCVHSLLRGNAEKIFKDLKKSVRVKLHLIVIRQTVAVDPVGIDQPLHRKLHPKEGSNTNYLFEKGLDKILKKLGEEATEIIIASKNPNPEEIKYEIADFLYHCMVLMAEKGVTWEDITEELAHR